MNVNLKKKIFPLSKKKLSIIFGSLPDMLIQQVLDFVGFDPNEPFILSYVCKYKRVVKIVNPVFMQHTLQFKISNPPICFTMKDKDNIYIGDTYSVITPLQIKPYTIFAYKKSDNYHFQINEKYNKYIRECTEMNKFIKFIRSQNPKKSQLTNAEEEDERKKKMNMRYKMCFCDPKSIKKQNKTK
jgi:hypothetical protein